MAHEADPNVHLFYNDYGGEGLGRKSDAIYALVKNLRQRGVPIYGVGLQMHVSLKNPPNPEQVAANIKRLNDLGLEVQITEMDVKTFDGTGTRAQKLAAQAQVYRNMMQVCLAARNCKAFLLWGVGDRYSWIPRILKQPDSPLIFDESLRPKPAYSALKDVLKKR
jgi:endo-1,4-beta-xylanase